MTFETMGSVGLDYLPCRYGHSKLLFRGPRRRLEGAYCVALGGTETYGKYIRTPFPALLEKAIRIPVVNLGLPNAGIDVFLNEAVVLDACNGARATIIQLPGAQNMSNRFYSVHPRRNDRFLQASAQMRMFFPEVDFTDFHFTRHMLLSLKELSPEKYAVVEVELKAAWVARMQSLLHKISGRTVLLWIGDHNAKAMTRSNLGPEPLLVDDKMVSALRSYATEIVRVEPSAAARATGRGGMIHTPMDGPVAAQLPGPVVHAEIADALAATFYKLL
ncbi:MAG: DUF6473 family protein [Paracoccaceae bacterium]|jgi:hypothetical protein